MEMWPGLNQAKLFDVARENVHVNGHDPKSGMTRNLTSNAVQLTFCRRKRAGDAKSSGSTRKRWSVARWNGWIAAAVRSRLAADKLALDFQARWGKPQLLNAAGAVQVAAGKFRGDRRKTATSATGVAQLSAGGELVADNAAREMCGCRKRTARRKKAAAGRVFARGRAGRPC